MARSTNIASLMEERARERPFQRAVVFPEGRDAAGNVSWTHLSFRQLNSLTDAYARGLVGLGVKQGDRVSLLVKPCLEFIPLVFAIFKVGAVPVLIDPGMGRKPFLQCIQRMAPRVLIAEGVVHTLRPLFGKYLGSVQVNITMGGGLAWGATPLAQLAIAGEDAFPTVHTAHSDEAAVLFTSGSTGPAKGVTYTHGIFDAQTRMIGDMYGIEPGEVDLACFPLFGMFSMALGMTVVIPDMDPTKPAQADPAKLVEAIQSNGCTQAMGSPAIWKRVGPWCAERGIRLDSLKRILMFGAPVPVWMHQNFRQVFAQGAQIHTPYGATESLPVATIGTDEVLGDTAERTSQGAGTCVGRVVPGVQVRVIHIQDAAIETWSDALMVTPGEVGELVIKGPTVTHEYKAQPEATRMAKIDDGGVVCHRIGDLGRIDDQGRIWFCGRKSHRILGGADGPVFPVPIEGVFNVHPAVYRTAVVGVDGAPVLVVEREPGAQVSDAALEAELRQLGAAQPVSAPVQHILFHPAFPVDVRHNAKIHRVALSRWAAGQLGGSASTAGAMA